MKAFCARLEQIIAGGGLYVSEDLRSSQRIRRIRGILIAVPFVMCLWVLLIVWLLIGKKPRHEEERQEEAE